MNKLEMAVIKATAKYERAFARYLRMKNGMGHLNMTRFEKVVATLEGARAAKVAAINAALKGGK